MPLLDQYGKPLRRAPQRIPAAPWLANRRLDVWTHINPDRMAMLFRQADVGDLSAVDELCSILPHTDAQVLCEAPQRTDGILQLEEQLQPATRETIDNEICDFVRGQMLDNPQWSDVKSALNHAWLAGQSAVEIVWSKDQTIAGFRRLPLGRLTYTGHDGLLLDQPLLLTDDQPQGVPLDPRNLVLATQNSLIAHPVRLGAYRALATVVMYKHYSLKDWACFLERYGIPSIWGKYSSSASPADIAGLENAVRSFISDSALVTSDSTVVELLDAAKGTGTNGSSFEQHAQYCDAAISKIIKGQALNSAIGPKGGSETDARTLSAGFIINTVAPDGMRRAGEIREQLIRPLVELHYGRGAKLPKYTLRAISPENFEVNIKCLQAAQTAGMEVSLQQAYARLGWQQPEIDDKLVQWPGQGGLPAVQTAANKFIVAKRLPGEQAAEQAQDDVDRIAEDAAVEASRYAAQNMAMMIKAVQSANDYPDALAKIQVAAKGLAGDEMEGSLRRGVLAGLLRGMEQVQAARVKGDV